MRRAGPAAEDGGLRALAAQHAAVIKAQLEAYKTAMTAVGGAEVLKMFTCDHKAWPGTASCTASMLVTQIAPDGGTEPITGTNGFDLITPLAK